MRVRETFIFAKDRLKFQALSIYEESIKGSLSYAQVFVRVTEMMDWIGRHTKAEKPVPMKSNCNKIAEDLCVNDSTSPKLS